MPTSADNIGRVLHDSSGCQIKDPGSAGSIYVDTSLAVCELVSAAAETRTLAAPTESGVIITIIFKTDGGDITMTVTNGYDLNAFTTYTFTDAGQVAVFRSVKLGSTYYWRLVNNTAQQVPYRTLTTTATIRQDENGKTFFLNLAAGFVTTLPAPFAGGKYTIVLMTAPSGGSYTVVTNGSANVFAGSLATAQDAGGSSSSDDDGDTITFVDSKALPGDQVTLISNGTTWFVRGQVKVFDGMTITKAT